MEQIANHLLQLSAFIGAVLLIIPLLGRYWANLAEGKVPQYALGLDLLEKASYRIGGIDPLEEMRWTTYLKCFLSLMFWSGLLLFAMLMMQGFLPFNPQQLPGVPLLEAFNIAASFITNTNWQSYAPETTLSYGSQMWGLTVQNFLSAATGSAVLMALIRGLSRRSSETIGNFWADLIRTVVYLLLPVSIILSLFFVSQGAIQSLREYVTVETLEGGSQTIPLGPAASQVAIKQFGTNGGGFFNANGAHPFENPTPLTNFVQQIAIIALPAAMIYGFGVLIKSRLHAWILLTVMFIIWAAGFVVAYFSEWIIDPVLQAYPVLEGEEMRFGTFNGVLWTTLTTATANGSVNAMLDSMSPLAGGVALFNMMLGESVFGGVGVGLCSMLMFVLLTVFLCGLMIGRSPEYLGKKLEKREVQWVLVAVLVPTVLILAGTGISLILPAGYAGLSTEGPHGLTQMLYAFASAATNNGSAFSGFHSDTDYYQAILGVMFILGRLAIVVPSLAIAGSLGLKKTTPHTIGSLSTNSLMFAALLTMVILIVGMLTFFPALSLGPILEHLLMMRGDSFPRVVQ